MQRILFLLILVILSACGGGKKTIQSTEGITLTKPSPIKEEINEMRITDSIKQKPVLAPKLQRLEEKEQESIDVIEEVSTKEIDTLVINKERFDHTLWNDLLEKYVQDDGRVDYVGFKKERGLLKSYLSQLSEQMPQVTWSETDKLAYWMNAYNAFTVQLIINNYPVKSIKDIKDPWDARFFKLDKKWYNLNEIEHQILRKMGDPRIHFGINCASFSCPPLLNKAFTAQNVHKELDKLAIRFINDHSRNKITSNPLQLSKIFNWFAKDFKTTGTLIDYLNLYAKTKISNDTKKGFMKYNWDLNE